MSSHKKPLKHISDSGIYKSFFNHHPDAVYVLDLAGRYLDANPACFEITGYSREQFLSIGFAQLIIPEKLEKSIHIFKKLLEGKPQKFETAIFHKNGQLVHLHVTSTPIVLDEQIVGVFSIAKDITEQKNTERLLKEREQRYESLKRNNPNGVCSVGFDGRIQGANPACQRMTGYSLAELEQLNAADVLTREIEVDWVRGITHDGALLEHAETQIIHKEGRRVDVRATSVPIVIDGAEIGYYLIMEDITQEKRNQHELFESQKLFTLLSENSRDIISHHTADGICRYVSPAIRALLGYDPEEIIGRRNAGFLPPDDLEYIIYGIGQNLLQGKHVDRFSCRVRHKNGDYLWFETTVKVIRDQQGAIINVVGVSRDITYRMETEQKLQESEERYRRLVENSLDAIGVIENGVWTYMSATGLKMFDAGCEEEIIGKPNKDFLHPDHHEECDMRVRCIMAGKPVDFVEQKWFRLTGEVFHADVIALPFNEKAIQVIIRDVSDRKRADEMLLRSEKLTAVGQLAAGIAHEIRNPLTALKGFTQILHAKTAESNRRYFDIMRSELERIEMILSEMLVLAKPQAVQFKPRYVELILQEVITLLAAQAVMKDVMLQPEFEPDLPMVLCEESQLKQVVVNVIKNGIEAMPSGGSLNIRLRTENGYVCMEFIDEGVGIPEDRIPKLGEPFFTTKEKGTGLGLMVSHKIISSHKGKLEISSQVGQGTTVKISLPIASV